MMARHAAGHSFKGRDGEDIIELLERALDSVDRSGLPPYIGARLDEIIVMVRNERTSRSPNIV